jgi:hypothetical protein
MTMAGLIDKADGEGVSGDPLAQARQNWEASMERRLESLKEDLHLREPRRIAYDCGISWEEGQFKLRFWHQAVVLNWPALGAEHAAGEPCSTFDTAMLLYYLNAGDGSPMADRWISFRELPGGAFYNQAFQGYSGDRLARSFSERPDALAGAAVKLGGWRLPMLSEYAFAFQPLPRIRLASVLWPGDEDFPTRAAVLFDAASSHYMITDGLALLGSGLTGRLIKARDAQRPAE